MGNTQTVAGWEKPIAPRLEVSFCAVLTCTFIGLQRYAPCMTLGLGRSLIASQCDANPFSLATVLHQL